MSIARHLILACATGLYTGYFPIYAGTFGTLPAWLIAWFVIAGDNTQLLIVTAITVIASFWIAGAAEKFVGHDAKKIVIDEWAGMFVALLWVPFRIGPYILALIFFRLFDALKPWPANRAEKLPGGIGVTMDDVVAGIQANLAVQLILFALTQANIDIL